MSGHQYIKGIWAKNKRDPSIIMHPRSRRDGKFMVSLSGKSNNYVAYTEEQLWGLVNRAEFTEHSTIRMASPSINCKENGNGYLPLGFDGAPSRKSDYKSPEKLKTIPDGPTCEDVVDERTLAAIKTRRGQAKFRGALMSEYGNTCQVTGCQVNHVLEAAHIFPHDKETNYRILNGLLLRSDIHTLFDLNLISLDEHTKITVDASLLGTEYEQYHGKILLTSVPEEMQSNLKKRLKLFSR